MSHKHSIQSFKSKNILPNQSKLTYSWKTYIKSPSNKVLAYLVLNRINLYKQAIVEPQKGDSPPPPEHACLWWSPPFERNQVPLQCSLVNHESIHTGPAQAGTGLIIQGPHLNSTHTGSQELQKLLPAPQKVDPRSSTKRVSFCP